MAIMGFLVHTLDENVKEVEARVKEMPEMTTYGIHDEHFIVVVAEAPSDKIEEVVEKIKEFEGVLTIYTTYLTIEDEIDENGNLQTNIDLKKVLRKKSTLHKL